MFCFSLNWPKASASSQADSHVLRLPDHQTAGSDGATADVFVVRSCSLIRQYLEAHVLYAGEDDLAAISLCAIINTQPAYCIDQRLKAAGSGFERKEHTPELWADTQCEAADRGLRQNVHPVHKFSG